MEEDPPKKPFPPLPPDQMLFNYIILLSQAENNSICIPGIYTVSS